MARVVSSNLPLPPAADEASAQARARPTGTASGVHATPEAAARAARRAALLARFGAAPEDEAPAASILDRPQRCDALP